MVSTSFLFHVYVLMLAAAFEIIDCLIMDIPFFQCELFQANKLDCYIGVLFKLDRTHIWNINQLEYQTLLPIASTIFRKIKFPPPTTPKKLPAST